MSVWVAAGLIGLAVVVWLAWLMRPFKSSAKPGEVNIYWPYPSRFRSAESLDEARERVARADWDEHSAA